MNPIDPKKPATPSDVKWFPVRSIVFASATSLPGGVRSELATTITTQTNVPRWVIEYAPSWRHHKITFLSTDPRHEPQIRMIPEHAVRAWEPG